MAERVLRGILLQCQPPVLWLIELYSRSRKVPSLLYLGLALALFSDPRIDRVTFHKFHITVIQVLVHGASWPLHLRWSSLLHSPVDRFFLDRILGRGCILQHAEQPINHTHNMYHRLKRF